MIQTSPYAVTVLFIEHTHKRKSTLRQVAVRPSRHPPTFFQFTYIIQEPTDNSSPISHFLNWSNQIPRPLKRPYLPLSTLSHLVLPYPFLFLKWYHRRPALSGAIFEMRNFFRLKPRPWFANPYSCPKSLHVTARFYTRSFRYKIMFNHHCQCPPFFFIYNEFNEPEGPSVSALGPPSISVILHVAWRHFSVLLHSSPTRCRFSAL